MPVKPILPLIEAGELDRRITIQSQSMVPDAVTGVPSPVWSPVRICWAKIVTSSSKEFYFANQFTAESTHLVVVRWSPIPLVAGMQILYGARTFTIQNVEDVAERRFRFNLLCIEINGVSS